MQQKQLSLILIILLLAAGLLTTACSPGQQTTSAAAPVYTIEVSDASLTAPAQLPTGIVTVSFKKIPARYLIIRSSSASTKASPPSSSRQPWPKKIQWPQFRWSSYWVVYP
jgi:hypothetical protein